MYHHNRKQNCADTLFGKSPSKFKARVVVPKSRDLHFDLRHCTCGYCSVHVQEPEEEPGVIRSEDSSSESSSKLEECCYVCTRHCSAVKEYGGRTRKPKGRDSNSKLKDRNKSGDIRQMDVNHNEHYRTAKRKNYQRDPPKERRSTGNSEVQKTDLPCPDPVCALCMVHQQAGRNICTVCHLWERFDDSQRRAEYYSNRDYEDFDERLCFEEVGRKREDSRRSEKHRINIESCQLCMEGSTTRHSGDNGGKEEEKFRNSSVQCDEQVCSRVEKKTRKDEQAPEEGDLQQNESRGQRESGIRGYVRKSKDDFVSDNISNGNKDPIQKDVALRANSKSNTIREFKKSHSLSEIEERKLKDLRAEHLEDYKQQLQLELDEAAKDSISAGRFRPCNCEYSKEAAAGGQEKAEINSNEIQIIKQKCDEALSEIERCKKEIEECKQAQCSCDFTMTIKDMEECKGRCAQLDKKVTRLQQALAYYIRSDEEGWEASQRVSTKDRDFRMGRSSKDEYSHGTNDEGVQDMPPLEVHSRGGRTPLEDHLQVKRKVNGKGRSARSPMENQTQVRRNVNEDGRRARSPVEDHSPVTRRVKEDWSHRRVHRSKEPSHKKRAEIHKPGRSPSRVPRITCYHLGCFPPDQLEEIPSFKDCPGYSQALQGRRVVGRRAV